MLIFKEVTFDAAHYLPLLPDGHKCKAMHGHTYRLKIWLNGKPDDTGWVMDFAEMKKILMPVVDQLDHKVLNHVEGLKNPTCEMVAIWIWDHLQPQLPLLCRVELHETHTSGVVYEGQ